MSPTSPLSPVTKMSQPQRTASQDSSADSIRKRVCKACDRCRLKKSKCDGSSPCSRCKADNAICVFGERKKSHDKIYPKGYVEMLEQQQAQLVSGLQEMYKRLRTASAWDGETLPEMNGHPLTHDILAALDLLETKTDGSGELQVFEDDCQKLQSKLLASGAGLAHRRGSFSSESEQSQPDFSRSSTYSTPKLSQRPMFKENFTISAPSSPLAPGPAVHTLSAFSAARPSPLQQTSPLTGDPQLYQAEWAFTDDGMMQSQLMMSSTYALPQVPALDQALPMGDFTSWDGLTMVANSVDQMDLEFNQFIQIMT